MIVLSLALGLSVVMGIAAANFTGDLRGVPASATSLAASPLIAAAAQAVLLAAAIALACLVGRMLNAVVGMFVLGCVLGVLDMRSGSIMQAAFDGGSLSRLWPETLGWSVAVLGAAVCVFKYAGALPDESGESARRGVFEVMFESAAVRSMAATVAAPLLIWFVVRTDMKGQAIGAVVVGSMAAGLLARVAAPDGRPILIYGAVPLAIGLAQAIFASGAGTDIAKAIASGSLTPVSFLMPLDVAAGSCVGVSLGIGWARSFVKQRPHEALLRA